MAVDQWACGYQADPTIIARDAKQGNPALHPEVSKIQFGKKPSIDK
jgi:hypothetical protein